MNLTKINNLTLTELKLLQRELDSAIANYDDRRKSEALAELHERAKQLGFTLAELTGTRRRRKSAGPGRPKYRHPENPEITWTGKGRRPAWFLAAL
ncbi:H-NS histone family protein [Tabrizicola sp.]|uniref:H-NS histone family protein n=1 Tax=Tabrizicola sp. TaxID=2005166 RepID=UPI003F2C59D4